ncbi:MAG: cation transporter [Burkholderiaceae bacterium]|nr:cation transporter [Burkholderiaceae bacterium]
MNMPIELPEEDHEFRTPEEEAQGRRSTWVSVWVNVLLTIGQVATGLIAQSQGLIADGIHSLSDLLADFIVLVAGHHSKKAADDDHHYGHHRYENAASLVLGVLLLVVAIGMIWSAVKKLEDPDEIATVHQAALWVAAVALVAKELLFRYMLAVAKRIRSTMLVANAWHARSDALSSLVVAVGIIGNMMGYPLLDPIAALIVGLMVGKMGWEFSWDALHDLMDRAVSEEETEAIRATLLATPGILGLHDLRTRKVGDLALVDVHLEVDATMTVLAAHDIAVAARRRVLQKHAVLNVMTHLDPHGHRDVDHDEIETAASARNSVAHI